jgi:hypothetical protein
MTTSESKYEQIINLYTAKPDPGEMPASMAQVARKVKVSREYVRQVLKSERIPRNPEFTKLEIKAAKDTINQRGIVPLSAVCEQYDVDVRRVRRAMRKLKPNFDYAGTRKAYLAKVGEDRMAGIGVGICKNCSKAKPWAEMSSSQGRRRLLCKDCAAQVTKNWRKANKEDN